MFGGFGVCVCDIDLGMGAPGGKKGERGDGMGISKGGYRLWIAKGYIARSYFYRKDGNYSRCFITYLAK